jgi:hypothetical protein
LQNVDGAWSVFLVMNRAEDASASIEKAANQQSRTLCPCPSATHPRYAIVASTTSQSTDGDIMKLTNAGVKLTVARLIEVAYTQNSGMTTKIVMDKGAFKLSVDEDGNAELTGKLGHLRFTAGPTLEKIGLGMRRISVSFAGKQDGDVDFVADVGMPNKATVTFYGTFNIVKLITECSGMLCQAARLLKGFDAATDAKLQQIMGY